MSFNLGDLGEKIKLGEKVVGDVVQLETTGSAAVHIRGIHFDNIPGLDGGQEFELVGVIKKVEKAAKP